MGAQSSGKNLLETVLGWLPGWLGFLLILLVGVVAIIYEAVVTPSAGLVAFSIAAIASVGVAWYSGAVSKPMVNPFERSFGGTVARIDGWAWISVFIMFAIATVVAVVVG